MISSHFITLLFTDLVSNFKTVKLSRSNMFTLNSSPPKILSSLFLVHCLGDTGLFNYSSYIMILLT